MHKVILTCAVTGSHTNPSQNCNLPISPQEIAKSSLEAAEAGAAIVHLHVRNSDSSPSMNQEHYKEVVDYIRARNSSLIINITTGPGGRYHPSENDPLVPGDRTNFLPAEMRISHLASLKPDIATVDFDTMNFGGEVVINTPKNIQRILESIYQLGIIPEIELFDMGDIHIAQDFFQKGILKEPMLASLITGIKYGMPCTPDMMIFARNNIPKSIPWTGFSIEKKAFPTVALSFLLGDHIRIGMEDTIYIEKGVLTKGNGELVAKAKSIIQSLSGEVVSADEARQMIGIS